MKSKYVVLIITLVLIFTLIYLRNILNFSDEIVAILITAILGVGGYIYQSIENNNQANQRLLQEKNLALWQDQKKLSFEFIEFLDRKFFFNPEIQNGDNNSEEYKKATLDFFNELNTFYDKMYLVLDTKLIKNISILEGNCSQIQRYYLLREIRRKMLFFIDLKEAKDEDMPYKSLSINNVTVPKDTIIKTFEDLKKVYPFIEKADKEDTIRSLPTFGIRSK